MTSAARCRATGGGWRTSRRPAPYRAASPPPRDRKSTRLNSSHSQISYAVFCLKKKTFHPHIAHSKPPQEVTFLSQLYNTSSATSQSFYLLPPPHRSQVIFMKLIRYSYTCSDIS